MLRRSQFALFLLMLTAVVCAQERGEATVTITGIVKYGNEDATIESADGTVVVFEIYVPWTYPVIHNCGEGDTCAITGTVIVDSDSRKRFSMITGAALVQKAPEPSSNNSWERPR